MILIGVTSYRIHESEKLKKWTKECLESLVLQECSYPYKIMLIDDSSSLFDIPPVIVVEKVNFNNVSKAWNRICSKAFYEFNYQYALIINNDVVLLEGSLQNLLNFAVKQQEPCIISGYKENGQAGWCFSYFLISKDVYETVGMFDEHFWGGGLEDWDYGERLKEHNISIKYCLGFVVHHEGHITKQTFCDSEEWQQKDKEAIEYYRRKWGNGKHKVP